MANKNVLINEDSLTAVADAIRQKANTTDSFTVAQMPEAIAGIDTEFTPVLQNKVVTPSSSMQTVSAGAGFDGLGTVTVNSIDPTYVGSSVSRRGTNDLTVDGAEVTVPSGYYATSAVKSVATASHPAPSMTFNSTTGVVTATHTQSAGYTTGGDTTATITVPVTDIQALNITQNGTYEAPSGISYSPVTVSVNGLPTGGTAGQVLTKVSSTDGDASWQTPSGGDVKSVDGFTPGSGGAVITERVLTQAQYDALTTAEKNNGMTYYISDAGSETESLLNSYVGIYKGSLTWTSVGPHSGSNKQITFPEALSSTDYYVGLTIEDDGQAYWADASYKVTRKYTGGAQIDLYNNSASGTISSITIGWMVFVPKSEIVPSSGGSSSSTPSSGNLTIDNIYPIGSIYISVNDTSPAIFIGGTWVRINDVFLLAAGNTYTAGDTGGEVEHTLTQSEIPNFTGEVSSVLMDDGQGQSASGIFSITATRARSWTGTDGNAVKRINANFGGGLAHNNMPPYLAVYMWKRTA